MSQWNKLKAFLEENLLFWSIAKLDEKDSLAPYYRGREESIRLVLEKMQEADGTKPVKPPGCCTG